MKIWKFEINTGNKSIQETSIFLLSPLICYYLNTCFSFLYRYIVPKDYVLLVQNNYLNNLILLIIGSSLQPSIILIWALIYFIIFNKTNMRYILIFNLLYLSINFIAYSYYFIHYFSLTVTFFTMNSLFYLYNIILLGLCILFSYVGAKLAKIVTKTKNGPRVHVLVSIFH